MHLHCLIRQLDDICILRQESCDLSALRPYFHSFRDLHKWRVMQVIP